MARRVIAELMARFDPILDFPDAGAPREHIRPGLRAVTRHNYVAYYVARQQEIVVVRVLHGSRDIDAVAAAGGFGA